MRCAIQPTHTRRAVPTSAVLHAAIAKPLHEISLRPDSLVVCDQQAAFPAGQVLAAIEAESANLAGRARPLHEDGGTQRLRSQPVRSRGRFSRARERPAGLRDRERESRSAVLLAEFGEGYHEPHRNDPGTTVQRKFRSGHRWTSSRGAHLAGDRQTTAGRSCTRRGPASRTCWDSGGCSTSAQGFDRSPTSRDGRCRLGDVAKLDSGTVQYVRQPAGVGLGPSIGERDSSMRLGLRQAVVDCTWPCYVGTFRGRLERGWNERSSGIQPREGRAAPAIRHARPCTSMAMGQTTDNVLSA